MLTVLFQLESEILVVYTFRTAGSRLPTPDSRLLTLIPPWSLSNDFKAMKVYSEWGVS